MDLKKIKYLFIIGFLLLNLFLAYVLLDQDSEQSLLSDGQGRLTNSSLSENINLAFDPSDDVAEITMRSAHRDTFEAGDYENSAIDEVETSEDDYHLSGQINDTLQLSGTDDKDPYQLKVTDREALDEWIQAGHIPYAEDYVFGFYDQQQRRIYYGQKVDAQQLFLDQTAELIFHVDNEERITSFEMTHVSDIKSEGPEQPMVTTHQAINNLSVSGRFVQDLMLYQAKSGYQDMLTVDDIVVYRPVWLLLGTERDGNMNQFYVDGIKGNIVRNENDPSEATNAEQAAEEANEEITED